MLDHLEPRAGLDEAFRLEVLESYDLHLGDKDERFNRLARIAANHFDTRFAFVSLITDTKQHFLGSVGTDIQETPREWAFGDYCIRSDDVMVVPDATRDDRFHDNPFVVAEPYFRFYAGAPLIAAGGARVGSLCVLDDNARERPERHALEVLQDIAAVAVNEMELLKRQTAETGQSQQALNEAQAAAKAGERAKSDFLSLVGHELRTPLNAILGYSELVTALLEAGDTDRQKLSKYLLSVRAGGQRLSQTIERIFAFACADAGLTMVHKRPIAGDSLLRQVAGRFATFAAEQGVELRVVSAATSPVFVADEALVLQSIGSLLENAIQYATRGGTVWLEASADAAGGSVVTVRDNGRGIAPADLQRAVSVFSQVQDPMVRDMEGLGLGLPLVLRLMELHGGTLDITKAPEGGTIATLWFPAT